MTTLTISARMLQVVNNLLATWDKRGEHKLLTASLQTCCKLRDFYVCVCVIQGFIIISVS